MCVQRHQWAAIATLQQQQQLQQNNNSSSNEQQRATTLGKMMTIMMIIINTFCRTESNIGTIRPNNIQTYTYLNLRCKKQQL